MALTSPPATTHPAVAAAAHRPRWISMTSSAQVLAGAQRVAAHQAGRGPHPGQVREGDRERPLPEAAGGDPRPAEVDPLDECVLAERHLAAGFGSPDRRVVTRAEDEAGCDLPARSRSAPGRDRPHRHRAGWGRLHRIAAPPAGFEPPSHVRNIRARWPRYRCRGPGPDVRWDLRHLRTGHRRAYGAAWGRTDRCPVRAAGGRTHGGHVF